MQALGIQQPDDLITIAEAMEKTKRSRGWITSRVSVYHIGRNDMVSESEVMSALNEWQQPKLKSKPED